MMEKSPNSTQKSKSMDRLHLCQRCSHAFEFDFQLDHHVQRTHKNVYAAELFHAIVEPEQFPCVRCTFKSYYNWDLYGHSKNHRPIDKDNNIEQESFCNEEADKYPCNYCDHHSSDSCLSLAKHTDSCELVVTRHRPRDNANSPTNAEEKRFRCAKCPFRTKYDGVLRRHTYVKHVNVKQKIAKFACAKCSYRTALSGNLHRPTRTVHGDPSDVAWFECHECSYRTKVKCSLTHHMLVHATGDDIRWFQCTTCSFKSKYKTCLKLHVMKKHTTPEKIAWFECHKCSFKTKTKDSLKKHMITHVSDERVAWFHCPECSFKTKHKYNVTGHVFLKHGGDNRRFKCAQCPYRTKTKGTLTRHMLVHAQTWLQCAACPFKTKHKCSLTQHVTARHVPKEQIKWVECRECSRRCSSKANLTKHMVKHAVAGGTIC